MAHAKDFGEPWTAARSLSWESAFRCPPAVDDPDILERWNGAKDRAKRDAEWIVWGSRMSDPAVAVSLTGLPAWFDDQALVARIRPLVTSRDDLPDHGEFARRIALCVSACAGIYNPQGTIDSIRGLLFDLLEGRADASDPRVLACAARLIPPDDFAQQRVVGENGEPP